MSNYFEDKNKCWEYAKYQFNDDEKRSISAEMADSEITCNSLKDKLKDIQTQIKAEIQAAESSRAACALKLRAGYEMRNIECYKRIYPDTKIVEYIDIKTGDIVKTVPAHPDDLQQKIFNE